MKPRLAKDLRELSDQELVNLVEESQETLAKQKFQRTLKQLQDTTYLRILRRDIAKMKTILRQRSSK